MKKLLLLISSFILLNISLLAQTYVPTNVAITPTRPYFPKNVKIGDTLGVIGQSWFYNFITQKIVSTAVSRGSFWQQYTTDVLGQKTFYDKARGTVATPLIIVSGDTVSSQIFRAYDGAKFNPVAMINALSVGTVALNQNAGNLEFWTSTNASPSVLTKRWMIDETGYLNGIGASIIQTTTGDLTLQSNGGNGDVILSPNGTGSINGREKFVFTQADSLGTSTGDLTLYTGAGNGDILLSPNGTGTINASNRFEFQQADTITVLVSGSGVAGKDLTIAAGSTVANANTAGGSLYHESGKGSGSGASNQIFSTGQSTTSGTLQTMTERMRITNEGSLAIGTTTPYPYQFNLKNRLHTNVSSSDYNLNLFTQYSTDGTYFPWFYFAKGRGTQASPTVVIAGDILGRLTFAGQFSTNVNDVRQSASIQGVADGTFSLTEAGGHLQFYTTPVGTVNPVYVMKIASTGKIGIGNYISINPVYNLSFIGTAAQTIGVEAATTTSAGANFTFNAGNTTATGTADLNGGMFSSNPGFSKGTGFSSWRAGRSGRQATTSTTVNTISDALIILSSSNMTDAVADTLFEIALGADAGTGVEVSYTIVAVNADTVQTLGGHVTIVVANVDAATVTTSVVDASTTTDVPAATTDMTVTWTATSAVGNSKIVIAASANAGFVIPTSFKINCMIHNGGLTAITQR